MTNDRWRIGHLVLKLQDYVLDHPGREITAAQVRRVLQVDEETGQALVGLLAEAGVLDLYARRRIRQAIGAAAAAVRAVARRRRMIRGT